MAFLELWPEAMRDGKAMPFSEVLAFFDESVEESRAIDYFPGALRRRASPAPSWVSAFVGYATRLR
jgi:hypothetical protein